MDHHFARSMQAHSIKLVARQKYNLFFQTIYLYEITVIFFSYKNSLSFKCLKHQITDDLLTFPLLEQWTESSIK